MKIRKIVHGLIHPYNTYLTLASLGVVNMSDERFLMKIYKKRMGYDLNLNRPSTFNEKLQWLKLYDRNSLYTKMVDKFEVKEFVATHIGEEYIIPTLGVWNNFDEINFTELPNQFVLKCTHDSGGLLVVTDKNSLNRMDVQKQFEKCLRRNYFYPGREWPYKNVKPRVIAEKYMEDSDSGDLKDYKFFCFNGKVKCFKSDFDRFVDHRANYYDIDMNLLPFGEKVCLPDFSREFDKPENFEKMIQLAEKLAEGIPFLRVDFYNVNGKIYFRELTFYPASGFGKFEPEEWDEILGSWIKLPIDE